ncbi:MAG: hypothetical protein KFB93_05660 [Simkaniaceae bacterium]|jgi:hypothetical protein|nr:MAG: hypothetical protein KFB93_05660 [Simkaniaceae bacterium]
MSNIISIFTTAYSKNLIDEAVDAKRSLVEMGRSWREPVNEVDIAKVTSFVAKIFGTISLGLFALSAFNIVQKRTASLGRIFFTANWFLGAVELLKAGNNLRFEYTMTVSEKKAERKARNQGEWFSGTRATVSHLFSKAQQVVRKPVEAFIIENPSDIEEFRATRVIEVAVKDTYVFGPLFNAVFGK